MRALKFRAYDKFNEVYYFSDKFKNLAEFFIQVQKCIDGENWIVVEQYAGAKDGNSVEIFEGDLFSGKDRKGDLYIREVKFKEGKFVLLPNKSVFYDHALFGKIIGNINQNPELLENKQG